MRRKPSKPQQGVNNPPNPRPRSSQRARTEADIEPTQPKLRSHARDTENRVQDLEGTKKEEESADKLSLKEEIHHESLC